MRFDELRLPEDVRGGIEDAGFEECTPIQEKAMPLALEGRDLCGQAQTGSGKTAAFVIPILVRLLEGEPSTKGRPRALAVTPTRELAMQIARDAEQLGGRTGLRTVAVFGGMPRYKQARELEHGVDILVGTPGRLLDFVSGGEVSLREIQILVLDEADRMFDMGFIKDIRRILRRLPPAGRRQTLLFSATLSWRVKALAWDHMSNPAEVAVDPDKITVDEVVQVLYHVGKHEKFNLLLGVLDREGYERVLIFVNTRSEAGYLADRLAVNGHPAAPISSMLQQNKRIRVLEDFRSGTVPILVATDVASRGLHVEDVSHVVNYDLPLDPEDYVHRIGRTARAGKHGRAITMACELYVEGLAAVEKLLGRPIPVEWAEEDMFLEARPGRPRSAFRDHGSSSPRRGGGGRTGRGGPRGRPRRYR